MNKLGLDKFYVDIGAKCLKSAEGEYFTEGKRYKFEVLHRGISFINGWVYDDVGLLKYVILSNPKLRGIKPLLKSEFKLDLETKHIDDYKN